MTLLALASCSFVAPDPSSDTGSPTTDLGDCPRYLACAEDLGEPVHTLEATYGAGGACWTGDPADDELCRAACADALEVALETAPAPSPACLDREVPPCEPADLAVVLGSGRADPSYVFYGYWATLVDETYSKVALNVLVGTDDDETVRLGGRFDDCLTFGGPDGCATLGEKKCEVGPMEFACNHMYGAVSGTASIRWQGFEDATVELENAVFLELDEDGNYDPDGELVCLRSVSW